MRSSMIFTDTNHAACLTYKQLSSNNHSFIDNIEGFLPHLKKGPGELRDSEEIPIKLNGNEYKKWWEPTLYE